MNKLDELDEFFLGKYHPFRLSFAAVSALPDEKRRKIMTELQTSWGWKAFYGGLGATCIASVIYFRLKLGHFPTDIGNIIGYGVLTTAVSVLGGAISGVIGEISTICRGVWNELLTINPNNFSISKPEADNSKMFELFRNEAIRRDSIVRSQIQDYHYKTNFKSF